jgi:hypothetical protein
MYDQMNSGASYYWKLQYPCVPKTRQGIVKNRQKNGSCQAYPVKDRLTGKFNLTVSIPTETFFLTVIF